MQYQYERQGRFILQRYQKNRWHMLFWKGGFSSGYSSPHTNKQEEPWKSCLVCHPVTAPILHSPSPHGLFLLLACTQTRHRATEAALPLYLQKQHLLHEVFKLAAVFISISPTFPNAKEVVLANNALLRLCLKSNHFSLEHERFLKPRAGTQK